MKPYSLAALIGSGCRAGCRLFACVSILLAFAATAATGDPDSFNPSPTGTVYTLTVQPDRSVLLGRFTNSYDRLARYLPNETYDAGFNPAPIGPVYSLAVQGDGKVLVGGAFNSISVGGVSVTSRGIARLNGGNGTVDTNFTSAHTAFNGSVNAMALQTNGGIIVGGGFTAPKFTLARLQADGTLDNNFASADNNVNALAVQEDGKILVGGLFGTLGGSVRGRLGRLNADGTLDGAFAPLLGGNPHVFCLAVQADGRILVGGTFTSFAGTSRTNLGRLNPNGTADTNFNANPNSSVTTLSVQADGKILVGGNFTSIGGAARTNLARLNADGTADTNFSVVLNGGINGIELQADGKVLVAGGFNSVNGLFRTNVVRLQNDAFTESLTVSNSATVQWLRGGSAPESHWVTFELSTNAGASYVLLGNGSRISGGWQLTGLSLPVSGQIRARAYTTGGQNSGSAGLVETVAPFPPPIIVSAALAGTNVALSWTGGVGPYQVLLWANQGNPAWQPIGDPTATNSMILPRTNNAAFYRVQGH